MDQQFMDFLESSDDYLHSFDEVAGGWKEAYRRRIRPPRYQARKPTPSFFRPQIYSHKARPGWSKLVGDSTSKQFPRAGAPWTSSEDRDLAVLFKSGIGLEALAKRHGRTEAAITSRLTIALNYHPSDLAALDFAPHKIEQEDEPMKMTPSRLILLYMIAGLNDDDDDDRFRQTASAESDLCLLTVNGFLTYEDGDYDITPAGRQLLETILESNDSALLPATQLPTGSLAKRFYLVASGEYCQLTAGAPQVLQAPPSIVHSSRPKAEEEARRLADKNPGKKFFVLEAVSVHETTKPSVLSREL